MTELTGSVVVVVGASGVLGSAIAAGLVANGAIVVRAGRGGLSGPDSFLTDLRDETAAKALIVESLAAHGRLDGLVVAAGVVAFGPADAVTDETLRDLFQTNTLAPIRLIREAAPHLAESAASGRKPFVVTISGIVAETPTAGLAAYSASKAALAAFVQASSRELWRSGIRVLDARPGLAETGLATRAIAGSAPDLPRGLDPQAVADRIIRAIVDDETDLPSTAF